MGENNPRRMRATSRSNILLLVLLWLFREHVNECDGKAATKDCYQALSECKGDAKCSLLMNDYANKCGPIVDMYSNMYYNKSSSRFPCSDSCVKAIKALSKTTKGKMLWTCDCDLDAQCLTLKTRTQKCLAIANGTYRKRTGCSYAQLKCMMDRDCTEAQDEFLRKCSRLFSLTACTTQCLCSQKKLFGLAAGRPLLNCECDGLDEMYCLGLRAHADSMKCNWRNKRVRKKIRKRGCKCRSRKPPKCSRRIKKD